MRTIPAVAVRNECAPYNGVTCALLCVSVEKAIGGLPAQKGLPAMRDTFTLSAMLFAAFSIAVMTDRPAQAACASLVASVCPRDQPATMTARFIRLPPRPPAYAVGETFPTAQHSLLMNPAHYGLPPVDGNWRYYRIKGEVFRVETGTDKVVEVVTSGNRRQLR